MEEKNVPQRALRRYHLHEEDRLRQPAPTEDQAPREAEVLREEVYGDDLPVQTMDLRTVRVVDV